MMNKINKYIHELTKEGLEPSWNPNNGELKLKLLNNRTQKIKIIKDEKYYVLTSVVAEMSELKNMGHNKNDIIQQVWEANRNIDLINLTIDDENNIVGRLEFLAEYLDPAEFVYSVKQLSMECDKYEFALTGEDKY